jgi:hypothetical protein
MPPPKSKKKKNKSSKSTAEEVARANGPNNREHLELQAFHFSNEWEVSPQRKALTRQIREQVSPQKSVLLNNAMCLGLGSLETAQLQPRPGCTNGLNIVNQGLSVDGDCTSVKESQIMKPVAKGKAQLLVFETVVACLREFKISYLSLWPSFTNLHICLVGKREILY